MTIPFHETVELAADGIELLAVAIMVGCTLVGTTRWLMRLRTDLEGAYTLYRARMAESLLIGLSLLVAADIIFFLSLQQIIFLPIYFCLSIFLL